MVGIWQLVIVLVVVALIFGTSKLTNVGKDLGNAIKGFKDSVTDKPEDQAAKKGENPSAASTENKPAE